jgi:hypothetical protein
VIDLKTNRVVNQTWVAHGDGLPEKGGTGDEVHQGPGSDKAGSNPLTGNEANSGRSSPGFIWAEGEYNGMWGRSLRLRGLEPGINDRVAARSVVLHAWGVDQLSSTDANDFRSGIKELDRVDLGNSIEMNAVNAHCYNQSRSAYNSTTKGCLGVSNEEVPVRQPDGSFKGAMNQRDYLIETLGKRNGDNSRQGSLIFNYIGPDQRSSLFD